MTTEDLVKSKLAQSLDAKLRLNSNLFKANWKKHQFKAIQIKVGTYPT